MRTITINGKNYIYYSVDDNKLNYTQRNNEYKWENKNAKVNANTMCNVTSICMALDYAGFKFPNGEYSQPEDNLAKFIMESNKIDEEYKKRYPAMYKSFKKGEKDCYTPNEIHKLLEIGVNEWMGVKVDTFSDTATISDIISDIVIKQSPVVMSGAFPQKNTIYHHVVCLVGLAFKKEYCGTVDYPDYYIIDDPWGYTHDYSNGKSGNNVVISANQFCSWFKPVNNLKIKYAHRFEKPVATV